MVSSYGAKHADAVSTKGPRTVATRNRNTGRPRGGVAKCRSCAALRELTFMTMEKADVNLISAHRALGQQHRMGMERVLVLMLASRKT